MIISPILDLKLLHLLLEIHDSGSVSTAGRNLGLSQPAASNALTRLRHALDDPLFVRSKAGMRPTPYAERIVPDIRAHLAGISAALSEAMTFDPARSRRIFRLSLSGLGEQMFLPPLAERIARDAPFVRLENISAPMADLDQALADRDADVAIGILSPRAQELTSMHLFDETYRAVGNPGLTDEDVARIDLKDQRIILVAPSATYAEDIEGRLHRHQLVRNVSFRLRHFGALPEMLRRVDAVAIVPEQLATALERSGSARKLPTRLPLGRSSVRMVWHRNSETDPGCRWLRGLIRELFAAS